MREGGEVRFGGRWGRDLFERSRCQGSLSGVRASMTWHAVFEVDPVALFDVPAGQFKQDPQLTKHSYELSLVSAVSVQSPYCPKAHEVLHVKAPPLL